MTSSLLLSRAEQAFIVEGCRSNCRVDGRKRDDFGRYTILTAPLPLANGSARLIGRGVHLLCSVKADMVVPAMDQPDVGVVEIAVQTLDPSSSSRTNRNVDESLCQDLLGDHLVDRRRLCVVKGEYVWRLSIDLLVLTGHYWLDAASHVMAAAMASTVLPRVETHASHKQGEKSVLVVDSDVAKAQAPPGSEVAPILVTIGILKATDPISSLPSSVLIVDADDNEYQCCHTLVHVAVSDGVICALQTSGSGSLPVALLPEITALALAAAPAARAAHGRVEAAPGSLLLQEAMVFV